MKKNYRRLKQQVDPNVFKRWQEIDAVVYGFTDLGIKVVINNEYNGLIYKNEVFTEFHKGDELKAFIKCIREDGRIDVSLQPQEKKHVLEVTEKVLKLLNESNGQLLFNDKSSSDDIKKRFQISKKVFKKAIGMLYKQRKIKITDTGIEIIKRDRAKSIKRGRVKRGRGRLNK